MPLSEQLSKRLIPSVSTTPIVPTSPPVREANDGPGIVEDPDVGVVLLPEVPLHQRKMPRKERREEKDDIGGAAAAEEGEGMVG